MAISQPRGKRALDRILEEEFVADLANIDLGELRERRADADREEAWLSYTRRMLHGRIDIMRTQIEMREQGVAAADELDIEALVQSLAGQMGTGSRHVGKDVIESAGGGRRAVERLIARSGLDEFADMPLAELQERFSDLQEMEREVSDVRTRVHQVQALLSAELTRRYRSGDATPDSALGRQG